MADVTEEVISIPFGRSWQWGKIPNAWQKAGVVLTPQKGKKDPGYLYLVIVTSVLGIIGEQMLQEATF